MKKKYKKEDPWNFAIETLLPPPVYAINKAVEIVLEFAIENIFPNSLGGRFIKSENVVKKNFKLKILKCLIPIAISFDLNERNLKIACHIIGSPWIKDNLIKTENELRKNIIETHVSEFKKKLIKYIEPLSDEDIYYLTFSLKNEDYSDHIHTKSLEEFLKEELRAKYIEHLIKIIEYQHKDANYLVKIKIPKRIIKPEDDWETQKVYSNTSLYLSSLYSSIISTNNLSKEFDDLTKSLFEDSDTIYKAAVDANYVNDKSLYGGPYHRLFDDSHSLGKMWGKIKEAKPDDSKIEEIIAWVNEAAKDVQTTMGLPVVSMNKETFDKMADFLSPVGVSKTDLYDLMTYNFQEVLSVAFLGITTMLPSIKKDKKKLRALKGVLLASGTFGNPLALIFLLITLVHSIIKGDVEQFKKDLTSKEALIGFTISAIIKYTIDFLGTKAVMTIMAILLGLVVVLYFVRHKRDKKIDLKKFRIECVKELENLKEMSKNLLEKENIKPLPKI